MPFPPGIITDQQLLVQYKVSGERLAVRYLDFPQPYQNVRQNLLRKA